MAQNNYSHQQMVSLVPPSVALPAMPQQLYPLWKLPGPYSINFHYPAIHSYMLNNTDYLRRKNYTGRNYF